MNRGHLLVVLIGAALVMTLTAQNLKKLAPLLASAAPDARGTLMPQDQEMLRQLGLQDTGADRAAFQKALARLTKARPAARRQAAAPTPDAPRLADENKEATLLKNWVESTLAQAHQQAHTAPAARPAQTAPEAKPVLEIYEEVPAAITNPHFTARQLRRARMMLRELRQNNTDTAAAIRQKFGPDAEEEAKQIALQTEKQAETCAQTAKTWESFEAAFEKNYTQGEHKLSALIKKHLK